MVTNLARRAELQSVVDVRVNILLAAWMVAGLSDDDKWPSQ